MHEKYYSVIDAQIRHINLLTGKNIGVFESCVGWKEILCRHDVLCNEAKLLNETNAFILTNLIGFLQ